MTANTPEAVALADWRRRINDLYTAVRSEPDPQVAHAHWLMVRRDLFRDHPMSPLPETGRAEFRELPVFEYDPAFRFVVAIEPISGEEIETDLGADGRFRSRPVARTAGLIEQLGKELTLYWITGYGGGLFLPFRDATNGQETYGGGRYLLDGIKGADLGMADDGRMILDFNFAYHPSCAWNPAYTCPLSPPENRITTAVQAGEKLKSG